MKKIVLVAIISFFFAFVKMNGEVSSELASLEEGIVVSVLSKTANETSGEIVFSATVKESGSYHLNFWQCQPKNVDGKTFPYKFEVNGKILTSQVQPVESGWSGVSYPNEVFLNKGENKIVIKVDFPSIPNVEFIELVKNSMLKQSRILNSTAYKNYISSIGKIGYSDDNITTSAVVGDPVLPSDTLYKYDIKTDFAPYSYDHANIPWFGYTFYTTAYFQEGRTISCTTQGKDNIKHVLEVFSESHPQLYSWVAVSDNQGKASKNIQIPESGIYYIKVRSFKNGSQGFCDLNVNNQMYYEEVPITTMGVKLSYIDKRDIYNIFTANSTGNPMLFVLKGGSYDGEVYAFNNDYESKGDFDWGRNARIMQTFSTAFDFSRIIVSSAESFNPVGKCEIYAGCKKSSLYITSICFENLKQDDAMMSAPASTDYNCIAWSGGSYTSRDWPPSLFSDYNLHEDDVVSIFDLYYSSERYAGCTRYTREGATEANSVIDLFGIKNNGIFNVTHASIKCGSDNHHHGYDWESKPGSLSRTFHPRYALEGEIYGNVYYHYKVSSEEQETGYSLEQSVADGRSVMEHVDLTESQIDFVETTLNSISEIKKNQFEDLYAQWNEVWGNTPFSNPDVIKETTEYSALLDFCRNNSEVRYIVFDKIRKGEITALPIFEDLEVCGNISNRRKLASILLSNSSSLFDNSGRRIVRTLVTNAKQLLKLLIDDEMKTTTINRQKRTVNFEKEKTVIDMEGNTLKVDFSIYVTSNVKIDVMNLKGEVIGQMIDVNNLESGDYNRTMNIVDKGVYLIRTIINGNIDVKKIIL